MFEGKVAVDLRGLAFDRISDGAVRRIAERVAAGERLAPADALVLYHSHDLLGIGTLADAVNRAKPTGLKGTYLKGISVATSMGPGIAIDVPAL